MEEIWRPIEGSNGYYEVSNLGRVMSHCNHCGVENRIMTQRQDKYGYLVVHLGKMQKQIHSVHRLVADAFIENPNNLPMVNHKDENKLNNNVENLEWCDARYNNTYGSRLETILPKTWEKWSSTEKARNHMREVGKSRGKRCAAYLNGEMIMEFESTREAARCLKATPSNIAKCCAEGKGTAKGYSWKYL